MTGKLLLLILISVCLVECAPGRRGGFRFRGGSYSGGDGGGGGIQWWHVWIILIVSLTVFATIMFTIQFGCCDGSFKADKPMEERDLKSWGDVRKSVLYVFLFFTGLWLPVGILWSCNLCCCWSGEEKGEIEGNSNETEHPKSIMTTEFSAQHVHHHPTLTCPAQLQPAHLHPTQLYPAPPGQPQPAHLHPSPLYPGQLNPPDPGQQNPSPIPHSQRIQPYKT